MVNKCAICDQLYEGFGHNADPVKPGERCCDDCNSTKVIPARIMGLRKQPPKEDDTGKD